MSKKQSSLFDDQNGSPLNEGMFSQQRKYSYAMQDEANLYFNQQQNYYTPTKAGNSFVNKDNHLNNSFLNSENGGNSRSETPNYDKKEKKKKFFGLIDLFKSKKSESIAPKQQTYLKQSSQPTSEEQEQEIGQDDSKEESKRTRQRSYDENGIDKEDLYFSISSYNPLQRNILNKQKQMKDIQNESLQTSYHIKNKSFKWSTKLRYPTITYKKGDYNKINDKNQQKFKMQDSQHLQKIKTIQKISDKNSTIHYKLPQSSMYSCSLLVSSDIQNIQKQINGFKSVEYYSHILSNFLDTFKQKQDININNKFQFQYFSKLDKGSFGQVDLYFFDIQDDQYTLNSQNNQVMEISNNYQFVRENFKQNQYNSFQSSQTSFQTNSTNINMDNSDQIINESKEIFSNGILSELSLANSNHNQQIINISQQFEINQLRDLCYKNNSQTPNNDLNLNRKILPAAGKMIKVQNEFIRELYIMETINNEYMPKLFTYDIDQQILFLELGLCSLYDLKMDSQEKEYQFSDEFTYSILLNLINAVESLLQNYNYKEQKQQPLFHSDIKPQNIILTVKKSNKNETQVKLLLIDFGGASFQLEDYWSYYTPAFVCEALWEKLVNAKKDWGILTWPQVRYAEIFAVCRSVQFLIVGQDNQQLFKKQNFQQFFDKYYRDYPKTCGILENVLMKIKDYKIFSDYQNVLCQEEINDSKQIKIYFEQEKLLQISKFYQIIDSQLTSPSS